LHPGPKLKAEERSCKVLASAPPNPLPLSPHAPVFSPPPPLSPYSCSYLSTPSLSLLRAPIFHPPPSLPTRAPIFHPPPLSLLVLLSPYRACVVLFIEELPRVLVLHGPRGPRGPLQEGEGEERAKGGVKGRGHPQTGRHGTHALQEGGGRGGGIETGTQWYPCAPWCWNRARTLSPFSFVRSCGSERSTVPSHNAPHSAPHCVQILCPRAHHSFQANLGQKVGDGFHKSGEGVLLPQERRHRDNRANTS